MITIINEKLKDHIDHLFTMGYGLADTWPDIRNRAF